MTVGTAFEMRISVENLNSKTGNLCWQAIFASARLTLKTETLKIPLWPFQVSFGFAAGDLSFQLSGCRAPLTNRLVSGTIPTSVSEKITVASELTEAATYTSEGSAGFSPKEGLSLGGKDGDQISTGEKSGSSLEVVIIRPLLHASGPDDSPVWRFEAAKNGTCLSGRAPGAGNPPLAILHFDNFPATVEATFSVLPNDVNVIALNPAKFDKKWIPTLSAARNALIKQLASISVINNGSMIVDSRSIVLEKPSEVAA